MQRLLACLACVVVACVVGSPPPPQADELTAVKNVEDLQAVQLDAVVRDHAARALASPPPRLRLVVNSHERYANTALRVLFDSLLDLSLRSALFRVARAGAAARSNNPRAALALLDGAWLRCRDERDRAALLAEAERLHAAAVAVSTFEAASLDAWPDAGDAAPPPTTTVARGESGIHPVIYERVVAAWPAVSSRSSCFPTSRGSTAAPRCWARCPRRPRLRPAATTARASARRPRPARIAIGPPPRRADAPAPRSAHS